jgi:glutamate N-acetyltransferase/amino-acid N-acetyltransferase
MTDSFSLPRGFRAAGYACGIKADPQTLDLSLFVSDEPCTAVGVFTQNRVVGAPVKLNRERLPRETVRGVILNSGNSNACTGQRGLDDARWMTGLVAEQIGCGADDMLVCSTGVIGRFLPREQLAAGIPAVAARLAATPEAFELAARGMMTTDTVPKQAVRQFELGGRTVTLSGACKGAAMIAPNMATMLAVVMTDAEVDVRRASGLLQDAVDRSFNCISVDEHMSTSDTVLLLANGAAGARIGDAADEAAFRDALASVCEDLAQQIIRDAEGASHFVTIDVTGCRSREDAWCIAKVVAESPLVKTAVAGNDPNWGRIVSAAGYAGVPFAEEDCSLSINGIEVYHRGAPTEHDATAVSSAMRTGMVQIDLRFTLGDGRARFWTCDLTAEYVRLNADYTT